MHFYNFFFLVNEAQYLCLHILCAGEGATDMINICVILFLFNAVVFVMKIFSYISCKIFMWEKHILRILCIYYKVWKTDFRS
jgi:hypothetical protein